MSSEITSAEVFPPGEYLRDELDERGWTVSEFAQIIDRPLQTVSEILNGKKAITPETAIAFGEALGTSAALWLNLQAVYQLHEAQAHYPEETEVTRRARLRSLVPVREIQKRGWLPDTDNLDELEASVCNLLGVTSPREGLQWDVAARRSNTSAALSPEQTAWIARIRQLGDRPERQPFDIDVLGEVASSLVQRIHHPHDLGELREWIADAGVTLVIELPLKGSKIDGAVVYANDGHPIIGLSTRGDRMDSFIFTLLHETAHVVLGHVKAGEVQVDEEILDQANESEIESEANQLAANWILPADFEISPGKLTMRDILGFARSYGVHPSFVIGRLQNDGRIGWNQFRKSIPKVRPFVDLG